MNKKAINLKCLNQATKLLSEPEYRGQRAIVNLPDRVIKLPSHYTDTSESIEIRQVEFVVELYCEDETHCWLEWELVYD